jgi:hypothetical protein
MSNSRQNANYLSIIGFGYLRPILALLERLEALPRSAVNEVHAAQPLNGFSASIVALSVLLVESAIARTQYDLGVKPPKRPLEFFRSQFSTCPHLEELQELYVIRDVIAHNHVWEANFTWDEGLGMRLHWAELTSGYGDSKLEKVIDTNTRTTKLLNLNLFPTRINRSDAIVVLKSAVSILRYLEEFGSSLVNISNQHEMYKGSLERFVDVVDSLEP